jgi:flagellar biosynthesis GTPase FlhF
MDGDVEVSSVDVEAGMDAVFNDTPTTETTTPEEVETTTEAPVEEVEESEESPASETEDTESSEEATDETEESKDEPDQKEIARQAYLQRQAERERREAEVAKASQELLAQAEDEQDLALKQLQIDAYQNKVTGNTDRLSIAYERAVKDIEVFNDPTPEIAEYLNDAIDEFQARHVTIDNFGNPIQVTGDLYQFLQTKAGIVEKLTQSGARKERTASARQMAAVTPPPSSSPKEPKVDPLMAGLDEVFSK